MENRGGRLLRSLRKSRDETIENIATDAGITYKTLQGIETGVTKSPSLDTLRCVVDALHKIVPVPLIDRQKVYVAYGYKKTYPLPTQAEINNAIQEWQEKCREVPYPAYLVDCAQRLLDWNQYAPRLVGLKSGDLQLDQFAGVTIYDVTFALSNSFIKIVNRDEYLADLMRTIKAEDSVFQYEDWYQDHLLEVQEKYPEFAELWKKIEVDVSGQFELGNNTPIKLEIPGTGILTFRLSRINFVSDIRFFVVQWIPMDDFSMLQCLLWVKEEAVGSSST